VLLAYRVGLGSLARLRGPVFGETNSGTTLVEFSPRVEEYIKKRGLNVSVNGSRFRP
jgi:hypothetical protein